MEKTSLSELIACPKCKGPLGGADLLTCESCQLGFPLVQGVPVLINEGSSVFRLQDYVLGTASDYTKDVPRWKRIARRFLPSISLNVVAADNYRRLASLLTAETNDTSPTSVLVVGGAVEGEGFGIDGIWENIRLVETDIAFGPRTNVICDAHDLSFRPGIFDGVIVQAVLEHVLDPARCVSEIERVLKPGGLVYAETPFMQQVHLGRFDFTRFTHLGHRRLFRSFAEIDSGPACGPGMALAWSYCYFLQSFFRGRSLRRAAFAFGSLTSFYLKYFDRYLISKPGSFDAASGYFFLGQKTGDVISDTALINSYRGAMD